MIRHATLTLAALTLVACSSDNTESAKAALINSIAIKTDISFSEVTQYPGGVVCGAFSGYVSYHDPAVESAPFIYRNEQIDRDPQPADWKVYCDQNPASALAALSGFGPITAESTQWLQITKDFGTFEEALEVYYRDNHLYPYTQEGLAALVEKPEGNMPMPNYPQGGYMAKIPEDPWGHPYEYKAKQFGRTKGSFELISRGRDGKPGGEGLDADISSKYQRYMSHIAEIL